MRIESYTLGPLICEPGDKIYIVSDLHLGHNKEFLWKRRSELYQKYVDKNIQFKDVTEYSQHILSELKELTNQDNCYLISLGDVSLCDTDGYWLHEFSHLNFNQIYTLKGNHFSGFKFFNKRIPLDEGHDLNNIKVIDSCTHLRITKHFYVMLSHFPLYQWDDLSAGVLCGHCHGYCKELNEEDSTLGRIFDCGVDNAIRLFGRCYFTLEEALNFLAKKRQKIRVYGKD